MQVTKVIHSFDTDAEEKFQKLITEVNSTRLDMLDKFVCTFMQCHRGLAEDWVMVEESGMTDEGMKVTWHFEPKDKIEDVGN